MTTPDLACETYTTFGSTRLPAEPFNPRGEFHRLRNTAVLTPWSQHETDAAIQSALVSGDIGFLRTAAVLLCQQDEPHSPILNHALSALIEEAHRLSPNDAFQIVVQLGYHVGIERQRMPPVCLLQLGSISEKIITQNAASSLPRDSVERYHIGWSAFAIERRFSADHSRLALHLSTLMPQTGYESQDAFAILLAMKNNGVDPLLDALRFSMPLAALLTGEFQAYWPQYNPLEFDFVGDLFNSTPISKRRVPAVAAMLLEAAERVAGAAPASCDPFATLLAKHLEKALTKLDSLVPGLRDEITADFVKKHGSNPITPMLLPAAPIRSSATRSRRTDPKQDPDP